MARDGGPPSHRVGQRLLLELELDELFEELFELELLELLDELFELELDELFDELLELEFEELFEELLDERLELELPELLALRLLELFTLELDERRVPASAPLLLRLRSFSRPTARAALFRPRSQALKKPCTGVGARVSAWRSAAESSACTVVAARAPTIAAVTMALCFVFMLHLFRWSCDDGATEAVPRRGAPPVHRARRVARTVRCLRRTGAGDGYSAAICKGL